MSLSRVVEYPWGRYFSRRFFPVCLSAAAAVAATTAAPLLLRPLSQAFLARQSLWRDVWACILAQKLECLGVAYELCRARGPDRDNIAISHPIFGVWI